jgi:hypothetical protein
MAAILVSSSSVSTVFFSKNKRVKFNATIHSTKGILDYVHVDVWGPSLKTSLGGANYMLTFVDDYSRKGVNDEKTTTIVPNVTTM